MLTVGVIGGVGINAASNSGQSAAVAQRPIIQTDIQTVHRTIHIKPKPVSAPPRSQSRTAVSAGGSAGAPLAVSSPPQAVSASTQGTAPSVSTHSSGGYSGEDHGSKDSNETNHDSGDHGSETEGTDG